MYVTATLQRQARALYVVEEVVVERDGAATVIDIGIALAPETALVVVVEEVVAEGKPLHVVLAVEQPVVTVFVSSIAIEELAVVYPDMRPPVGFGTILVGLYAYAVGVSHLCLHAVAQCHYLVFSRLEHRHTLHGETAVADNDVVHRLHDEGNVGKEGCVARLWVYHTDKGLVGCHHDALAVGGLFPTRPTLVVKQMSGIDVVHIALDAGGDVAVYDYDIRYGRLQVSLELGEGVGLYHLAACTARRTSCTVPVGTGIALVCCKAVDREITPVLCLCCHYGGKDREEENGGRQDESAA